MKLIRASGFVSFFLSFFGIFSLEQPRQDHLLVVHLSFMPYCSQAEGKVSFDKNDIERKSAQRSACSLLDGNFSQLPTFQREVFKIRSSLTSLVNNFEASSSLLHLVWIAAEPVHSSERATVPPTPAPPPLFLAPCSSENTGTCPQQIYPVLPKRKSSGEPGKKRRERTSISR